LQTNCGRGWALGPPSLCLCKQTVDGAGPSVLLRSVFANALWTGLCPRSSFPPRSLTLFCNMPWTGLAAPLVLPPARLPGPTHRPPPSPACSRLPVHLPPAGHRPPDRPAARPAGWRRWPPAAACPPPAPPLTFSRRGRFYREALPGRSADDGAPAFCLKMRTACAWHTAVGSRGARRRLRITGRPSSCPPPCRCRRPPG
jgi:hypothetical protein